MIDAIADSEQTHSQSEAPEPEKKSPEQLLSESANAFLLKLDALLETVNRIMLIIFKSKKRAQEELTNYLNPLFEGQHSSSVSLAAGSPEYRGYLRLENARAKALEAQRIVPQSFLVSMVSQYDAFLVAAIKNLFLLKPEKIRMGDRSICVKDLVRFSSIEEVLQELIEDEVDEVLRGSHLSQLQWACKKFDFTIDTKDPLIEKFIETTKRRNCYVHAEGLVSKQYRDRTKELNASVVTPIAIGEHLTINRAYMQHARDTLFETGIRTVQIAWRKIRPDQSEEQDRLLIEIIFELLAREDFTLARSISDFASNLRDLAGETNRRTLCVNRAQAYKWSGKNDEAKAIVNKLDWGASSAHFRLAVAVINDDYEEVNRLIAVVPIEGNDGITASGYRLWPLFREIRKMTSFQNAFEEKFGEPLLSKSVNIPTAPAEKPGTDDLETELETIH